MSHKASHWAIEQLPETPYEKAVLLVLADYHNDEDDRCDPSAITVATLTSMSERHVRRCLESLQAQGFVWCQKRDRKPAQIFFNWDRPGRYDRRKKSADQQSAKGKRDPAKPDWVRPVEPPKSSTDTQSGVPDHESAEQKSADHQSPLCGQSRHQSADSETQTADSHADNPLDPNNNPVKNQEYTPPTNPESIDTWRPPDELVKFLEGTGFKVTDQIIQEFRFQLHDWHDKGWLHQVNIRQKFRSFVAERKHRPAPEVEETPQERKGSRYALDRPMLMSEMMEEMNLDNGGDT